MKHLVIKSITCTAIVILASTTWAQDIIVTSEAQKIEAKILEVSKAEIRYKDYDNPDGPIFLLDTRDINSIIYANGKVVLYNQTTQQEVMNNSNQKEEKELLATSDNPERKTEQDQLEEQLERLQIQLREEGAQLGQAIQKVIEVKNSYALDVRNTTKYPYRINLDGHILGVVNPYKTERFIVSVDIYGRMQAVQTSGYIFSPSVKEFRIPRQKKQTACTVVIK